MSRLRQRLIDATTEVPIQPMAHSQNGTQDPVNNSTAAPSEPKSSNGNTTDPSVSIADGDLDGISEHKLTNANMTVPGINMPTQPLKLVTLAPTIAPTLEMIIDPIPPNGNNAVQTKQVVNATDESSTKETEIVTKYPILDESNPPSVAESPSTDNPIPQINTLSPVEIKRPVVADTTFTDENTSSVHKSHQVRPTAAPRISQIDNKVTASLDDDDGDIVIVKCVGVNSLACKMKGGIHSHPIAFGIIMFLLFLLCLRRCRSSMNRDSALRGEYRAVAAQYEEMLFDNFNDDYSAGADDRSVVSNFSDEGGADNSEKDDWSTGPRRGIEMSNIHRQEVNGGLTLEEMNG